MKAGSSNLSSRTNKASQSKTGNTGVCDVKMNMPDYFRSTANKATDKRTS